MVVNGTNVNFVQTTTDGLSKCNVFGNETVIIDTEGGGIYLGNNTSSPTHVGIGPNISFDNELEIPIINQTSNNVQIQPNVLNKWGEISSLTITLATPSNSTIVNEYMIEFVSGNTATTLNLPSGLKYFNGTIPTIEANKTYQISILNNNVVVAAFS